MRRLEADTVHSPRGSAMGPDLFNVALGAEVRAWMARFQMNQTDMAHLLGITQTNFSKRVRGVAPFPVGELAIIASRFGITLGELLGPVADAPLRAVPEHDEDPAPAAAGTGSHAVRPVGLEPTTHGLKVRCSTN